MKYNTKLILAAIAILTSFYFGYRWYNPYAGPLLMGTDVKGDLVKKCQTNCDTWAKVCEKGCAQTEGNAKIACDLTCKASKAICDKTCTGKSGLRNGSLHHINVWNKDKKWLTRLTPWEPRNLHLEISDFPIYATRCADINQECNLRDSKWVLKIQNPGCYILWGGGLTGLYTTKGACL